MKNLIKFYLVLQFIPYLLWAQKSNVIEYLPANYVRNASVDYTIFIQRALNENSIVVFPNFPVLINDGGLHLKSDQEIFFEENSQLILKPTDKEKYALFHINNVENVKVFNANIKGDRFNHIGESGQWGMGFDIRNSKNIFLKSSYISEFWGDGIYISGKKTKNIEIVEGTLDNNRRNGISIISGDRLYIKDLLIKNTHGHYPMAAIDIEPNNSDQDFLGQILIENIKSENNLRGILIILSNYLSDKPRNIDIYVSNFKSINDNMSIKINGLTKKKQHYKKVSKPLKGNIMFEDINIAKFRKSPIQIDGEKRDFELAPIFTFKNISIDQNYNIEKLWNKLNSNKFIIQN